MNKTLADRYFSFLDYYDPYRDTTEDPKTENLPEMLYNLVEIRKDLEADEDPKDWDTRELLDEVKQLIIDFRMEGIKRYDEL